MMMGIVRVELDIVRTCRNRYDGRWPSPSTKRRRANVWTRHFLLLAARRERHTYDVVDQVLHLHPATKGDFPLCPPAQPMAPSMVGTESRSRRWWQVKIRFRKSSALRAA